ncbi:MAG TPA: AAA family ATPase [Polyangiaceae bacterium]|nr:AAA family ATPase [Polyangiaceae bacterium]
MDADVLLSDLRRWEAYLPVLGGDARERPVTLIETHISRVFLIGEHVFKLKKPVDFGFLDFTTLELRRRACEAEVLLNRRLAEGVYLGLVSVTRVAGGHHELGGGGELVDYAVHMKRLPDERRADRLLVAGAFEHRELDDVAQRLADFHAELSAEPERRHWGSVEAVRGNVEENFAQTREAIGRYLEPEQAAELERFQKDFLRERAELFTRRMNEGRIRDGHGDLRLEHVYMLGDGVAIIDCIEFNERFRFADVCADVAFLSMDLAEHGRVDLAERLLARYALLSNDFGLYALVDFYQSYRAHVRAKVAGFQALSPDVDVMTRERSDAEARRHYLLALSAARRPLARTALIVVCGVIASGKSHVAEALAAELALPVIVADRVRKAHAGVSAETPLSDPSFASNYSSEATRRVYEELREGATTVLASGRSVILDASFRSRSERLAVRELAQRVGAAFVLVECRASREVCLARLQKRAEGRSVSDGRIEIFDDFARSFDPIEELGPSEHVVLDTELALAENVRRVRACLPFG